MKLATQPRNRVGSKIASAFMALLPLLSPGKAKAQETQAPVQTHRLSGYQDYECILRTSEPHIYKTEVISGADIKEFNAGSLTITIQDAKVEHLDCRLYLGETPYFEYAEPDKTQAGRGMRHVRFMTATDLAIPPTQNYSFGLHGDFNVTTEQDGTIGADGIFTVFGVPIAIDVGSRLAETSNGSATASVVRKYIGAGTRLVFDNSWGELIVKATGGPSHKEATLEVPSSESTSDSQSSSTSTTIPSVVGRVAYLSPQRRFRLVLGGSTDLYSQLLLRAAYNVPHSFARGEPSIIQAHYSLLRIPYSANNSFANGVQNAGSLSAILPVYSSTGHTAAVALVGQGGVMSTTLAETRNQAILNAGVAVRLVIIQISVLHSFADNQTLIAFQVGGGNGKTAEVDFYFDNAYNGVWGNNAHGLMQGSVDDPFTKQSE